MPQAFGIGRRLTGRGDHLYTTSITERDKAPLEGYEYERIAGYTLDSPGNGAIPLYRLFSLNAQKHLYTTSATERDESVARNGYRDEGIAGYVLDSPVQGAVPLYRLFHHQNLDHLYTTSATERDESVARNGYQDEGIAGYVLDSPMQGAVPLYRLYKVVDSGGLLKITLENVQFNLDHMTLGPPEVESGDSQDLVNNSDVEQEITTTFHLKYSETKKWSADVGIKAGVETTIHSGLPGIVGGHVKITAESSSSLTWGEEVSEERSWSREVKAKVSAHSQLTCRVSVSKVKVTIPYSAEAIYHFSTGRDIRGRFTGIFSGDRAHAIQVSWDPPPPT